MSEENKTRDKKPTIYVMNSDAQVEELAELLGFSVTKMQVLFDVNVHIDHSLKSSIFMYQAFQFIKLIFSKIENEEIELEDMKSIEELKLRWDEFFIEKKISKKVLDILGLHNNNFKKNLFTVAKVEEDEKNKNVDLLVVLFQIYLYSVRVVHILWSYYNKDEPTNMFQDMIVMMASMLQNNEVP